MVIADLDCSAEAKRISSASRYIHRCSSPCLAGYIEFVVLTFYPYCCSRARRCTKYKLNRETDLPTTARELSSAGFAAHYYRWQLGMHLYRWTDPARACPDHLPRCDNSFVKTTQQPHQILLSCASAAWRQNSTRACVSVDSLHKHQSLYVHPGRLMHSQRPATVRYLIAWYQCNHGFCSFAVCCYLKSSTESWYAPCCSSPQINLVSCFVSYLGMPVNCALGISWSAA